MTKQIIALTTSAFILLSATILAQDTPSVIKGVPLINQLPELPTGCEMTALTMLLQYNDFEYSKTQVADFTRKSSVPVLKNGMWYGEHPNEYFIGSPYSKNAYGTYAPNIARTIEKLAPGRSLNLTGKEFLEVLNMIDEGQPIVMWVTIDLAPPRKTLSWKTPAGKFQWIAPEHAVLVVGYDDSYIYANDPLTGKQEKYPRDVFEMRWNSLGKQAVTMKPSYSKPDLVYKGMPIKLNETQRPLIYNNNIWIPIRVLQKLDTSLEIIPNGMTPDMPIIRFNGKPIMLETGALPGLVVKFLNGTNYINIDFVNNHLGTRHTVTDDQLRLY